MSILKSLKIVAEENRSQTDPFKAAKQKLIQNLETQLKCAEAMVKGETYMQARIETVEENGTKVRKTVNRPIRHWYWRDGEGKVRLSVRVLNKHMEIEQGKTDILVGNDKELPKIVKALLEAASAGELDVMSQDVVEKRKKRKAN